MTGAGYLLVLGAVVFAAGWLAHDYWQRAGNTPDSSGQRARPSTVRVIPPIRDWNREGWS